MLEDVDIGDKIMLVPMLDHHKRTLGIVTSGQERKGVCVYKHDGINRTYTPYEYDLSIYKNPST